MSFQYHVMMDGIEGAACFVMSYGDIGNERFIHEIRPVNARFPKGRLLHSKRPCFSVRKVAFWNAKDHLSEFCFYSEKRTCITVCPTAFSTFLSICAMSSLIVCHVGPNPLRLQSG